MLSSLCPGEIGYHSNSEFTPIVFNSMLWLLTTLFIILLWILYVKTKSIPIPGIPSATPSLPFFGNSISFRKDPIKFLQSQQARHGNIFLVDLMVLRIVFCLGPEGNNAVFKGTEESGISMYAAVGEFFSVPKDYCTNPHVGN